MKTQNIINKIIKNLSTNGNINPDIKIKKKNKKSYHETESEENKSSNTSVYSSQSKSKSYTSKDQYNPHKKSVSDKMEIEYDGPDKMEIELPFILDNLDTKAVTKPQIED